MGMSGRGGGAVAKATAAVAPTWVKRMTSVRRTLLRGKHCRDERRHDGEQNARNLHPFCWCGWMAGLQGLARTQSTGTQERMT